MGLAPVPGQGQRELEEQNKCPAEPWEVCWIHYTLGKSESTMAPRTLQAVQQMVLFWLAQEAGVKATSRHNGAAINRVEKNKENYRT